MTGEGFDNSGQKAIGSCFLNEETQNMAWSLRHLAGTMCAKMPMRVSSVSGLAMVWKLLQQASSSCIGDKCLLNSNLNSELALL